MFNKAKRALDPQKVLDPLVFLPIELAEMVCQYLPMRDKVYVSTGCDPAQENIAKSFSAYASPSPNRGSASLNRRPNYGPR
jgi:hypothetical protein